MRDSGAMDGASMRVTDATPMDPAAIATAGATVATGTARASMAIGIAAATAIVAAGPNRLPKEAVSGPSGRRIAVASSGTATVMATATLLSRRPVRSSAGRHRQARSRRTGAPSGLTGVAAAAAAVVADVAGVVDCVRESPQLQRPI